MDPIREGATGAAVEDIQERLASLGYEIDAAERDAKSFGSSTTSAVARFRIDHNMPLGGEIDSATWIELVDAGYEMGDRTLYLRLPNLHGNDVRGRLLRRPHRGRGQAVPGEPGHARRRHGLPRHLRRD